MGTPAARAGHMVDNLISGPSAKLDRTPTFPYCL
jgi:hypothetical protein